MKTRTNIKGNNMSITPAISDYLYKKLDHLKKFIDPTDETVLCQVELGKSTEHHKSGDIFRTEINLHTKNGDFRSVAEESDLYASMDVAKDEIVRELQSSKDKRISRVRRGGARLKNMIKGLFIKEQI